MADYFKSKSQIRRFEQMENDGQIAQGTTESWLANTFKPEELPERTKPKQPTKARTSGGNGKKSWGFYS